MEVARFGVVQTSAERIWQTTSFFIRKCQHHAICHVSTVIHVVLFLLFADETALPDCFHAAI
jgi:hypothetical protein